jgi:hypothetical protein
MAEREGMVAAGPPRFPAAPGAEDPGDGTPGAALSGTVAKPVVKGPRKADTAEQSGFFDQPVRQPTEQSEAEPSSRVTLKSSPAEVVVGAHARTTELRAALDDLRRVLDDVDSVPTSPRRRRLPLIAVAGGVAAVVAAGLLVNGQLGADDTTGAVNSVQPGSATSTAPIGPSSVGPSSIGPSSIGSSGGATGGQLGSPGAAASSAPVAPSAPAAAAPVVPAGVPTAGPGVTEPGITATAVSIDPVTGTVEVFEQVMLAGPADALPLSVVMPTALRGDVGRLTPAVQDLTVALDGRPTHPVPAAEHSWVAAPTSGSRFTRALLRYRVTGAFVMSKQSVKGRGFIVLSPLSGQAALRDKQSVLVRVIGPSVRGISCPTAPANLVVCEQLVDQVHTATLPAGTTIPLLLLQVDLPQYS